MKNPKIFTNEDMAKILVKMSKNDAKSAKVEMNS